MGFKPAPTMVQSVLQYGRVVATWYKIPSANLPYSQYGFWTT